MCDMPKQWDSKLSTRLERNTWVGTWDETCIWRLTKRLQFSPCRHVHRTYKRTAPRKDACRLHRGGNCHLFMNSGQRQRKAGGLWTNSNAGGGGRKNLFVLTHAATGWAASSSSGYGTAVSHCERCRRGA